LLGVNANGNGLSGQGREESGLGSLGYVSVFGELDGDAAGGVPAGAEFGGVWVGGLSLNAVLLNVLEGVVGPSSVASVVAELAGAVEELLLGEGDQLAIDDELGALESTGGGEGPAGAALTLVLDTGDGALGNPVNGISVAGNLNNLLIRFLNVHGKKSGVELEELLGGQIGEAIGSEPVGVLGGVGLLDVLHVGVEYTNSEFLFGGGVVGLVPLGAPVVEGLISPIGVGRFSAGNNGQCKDDGDCEFHLLIINLSDSSSKYKPNVEFRLRKKTSAIYSKTRKKPKNYGLGKKQNEQRLKAKKK
jgi:hypothetical protein